MSKKAGGFKVRAVEKIKIGNIYYISQVLEKFYKYVVLLLLFELC